MTAPANEGAGGLGKRIAVALLTLSAAGFVTWQASEGYTPVAVIPTKGDVPTIGHGSTRYEDGRRVKMGDRIDRRRAAELARNLISEDERAFAASMPDARLSQAEFDLYLDFVGQYGMGNWRRSSMRRQVMAGNMRPRADRCSNIASPLTMIAARWSTASRTKDAGACGRGSAIAPPNAWRRSDGDAEARPAPPLHPRALVAAAGRDRARCDQMRRR